MLSVSILGVGVQSLSVPELHEIIGRAVVADRRCLVLHVNVRGLNLACEHEWLRGFLNSANVVLCDGAGVNLGLRVLGHGGLAPRITFADWTWQLAEFAEASDFSFFFLGSRPGVAERAAQRLKERFSGLRIAGIHHGYFDKTPGSSENETIVRQINAARPNILIVGFGMPIQERWLMENWNRLETNVAITAGAAFDYVSSELRRAPSWMTDNGLEWLGRLSIEPRRLWRRYLVGNPVFLYRVLKERLGLLESVS